MSTPHNNAEKGEIAKSVLLPGDPLRAKFIAENYLSGVKCFNEVRGALGYTGTYKGIPISVMGTGMGCASMGIYSYELIHHYECTSLIRIGSCGAFTEKLKVGDLVMAIGASTDTNYAGQYQLEGGNFSATASFRLLSRAVSEAEKQKAPFMVGNVYCTDVFYRPERIPDVWKRMGILAAEMESFALYCNAAVAGVDALTILTVSDHLVTGQSMTPLEREKSFKDMMVVALETAAA
ncbi:MAG: purine-nucleoside phosphorylase [Spirochaetaceae bacterium]|jgi:purine-nucleoside phosphorylase|nr:purine-nucleoside phosphorylase [Spirochaetaceae bacterium]